MSIKCKSLAHLPDAGRIPRLFLISNSWRTLLCERRSPTMQFSVEKSPDLFLSPHGRREGGDINQYLPTSNVAAHIRTKDHKKQANPGNKHTKIYCYGQQMRPPLLRCGAPSVVAQKYLEELSMTLLTELREFSQFLVLQTCRPFGTY